MRCQFARLGPKVDPGLDAPQAPEFSRATVASVVPGSLSLIELYERLIAAKEDRRRGRQKISVSGK
jgi:hypothetical protein